MRQQRVYEKGKQYISVSQFTTCKGCHMKWYLKNVAYVKDTTSASKDFGNLWDALMEAFIDNKDIDKYLEQSTTARKIFEKSSNQKHLDFIKSIPNPETQKQVTIPLKSGAIFIGDMDLYSPSLILDFKSTSNWNYAKTSIDLAKDPQMLMYGKSQKGTKELCHIQCNTRDYEMRDVWADFNYDQAVLIENEINAMSITMQGLRQQKIEFVKKTWSNCESFGKCHNIPFCQGKETIEQLKERTAPKMALPRNAETKTKILELKKELKGEKPMGDFAAKLAASKANAETASKQPSAIQSFKKAEPLTTEKSKFVFNKKSEIDLNTPVETQAPVAEKKSFSFKKTPPTAPVEPVEPEEVEQAQEPVVETPDVEAPVEKRTRKAKTEKTTAIVSANTMKAMVFVNCMPMGIEVTQPSIMLKDEIAQICETNKISCLSESKYNEAAKLLFKAADEIKKELASKNFVYIDTKRIADNTVLEMLIEDERFVIIRGVW